MPPPTVSEKPVGATASATKPEAADKQKPASEKSDTGSVDSTARTTSAPTKGEPERQRSGFFTLLLGGLLAGLIGYGVAYLQHVEMAADATPAADTDDRVTALASQVEALEAQIADLPVAPIADDADQSATVGVLDELQTDVADLRAQLTDDVAALRERIEAAPTPVVNNEEAQSAAVAQLSAQIADQQARLQDLTAEAEAQLAETRAEAEAIRAGAVETARDATARTALANVQDALGTGAPMTAALADLGDSLSEPVPEALTAVEDGASTLATLQDSFGEYARAANAEARAAGDAGEDAGRFTAFVRSQLDVRSTAPREGNSVDAILSRAEAALRAGRLNDTLAEIATLPESARAAMSDWTAAAEARAAALDAADTLATSLNAN